MQGLGGKFVFPLHCGYYSSFLTASEPHPDDFPGDLRDGRFHPYTRRRPCVNDPRGTQVPETNFEVYPRYFPVILGTLYYKRSAFPQLLVGYHGTSRCCSIVGLFDEG